jgi:catechol 2,3-dioxygenase-like lactoylglutathione lyase family enzyme
MAHLMDAPTLPMLAEHDLDAARRFWKTTVGLDEVSYDENGREAVYKAGSTLFGIYQHEGGSRADHTQLAFQVQDVAATVRGLRDEGVRFEEYDLPGIKTVDGIADMGGGELGAWFLDPGGNIIGIFSASEQFLEELRGAGMVMGATR